MTAVKFLCKDCKENVTKDELEYLTKPDPHEGHTKVWFVHPTMERPEEVSPEVSVQDTATFDSDVKQFRNVLNSLGTVVLERSDALRVQGLALLSREHAIYYGEPGTAKNLMVETFAECLDHSYFQYQIHQATTDAELFGPFDIGILRERSEMRRNIRHTILDTEIAFLDEIGNSNSMIRNSLKELMQGKRFSVGGEMIATPIQSIFAASNSILEYNDPTEHAFEDRFLFRHEVRKIQQRDNLVKMFATRDTPNAKLPSIDHAIMTRLQSYVNEVTMGPAFYEMLADFILSLESEAPGGLAPMSNRRHMKLLKAIAANAVLNGRKKAKKSDLSVLLHIGWNEPSQIVELGEWLRDHLTSSLDKAEAINGIIEQAYAAYQQQQANLTEWTDKFSNGMLSRQMIEAQLKALNAQTSQVEDEDEREQLNKYIRQADSHVNEIMLEMLDLRKDNGDSPDYDDLESLKK